MRLNRSFVILATTLFASSLAAPLFYNTEFQDIGAPLDENQNQKPHFEFSVDGLRPNEELDIDIKVKELPPPPPPIIEIDVLRPPPRPVMVLPPPIINIEKKFEVIHIHKESAPSTTGAPDAATTPGQPAPDDPSADKIAHNSPSAKALKQDSAGIKIPTPDAKSAPSDPSSGGPGAKDPSTDSTKPADKLSAPSDSSLPASTGGYNPATANHDSAGPPANDDSTHKDSSVRPTPPPANKLSLDDHAADKAARSKLSTTMDPSIDHPHPPHQSASNDNHPMNEPGNAKVPNDALHKRDFFDMGIDSLPPPPAIDVEFKKPPPPPPVIVVEKIVPVPIVVEKVIVEKVVPPPPPPILIEKIVKIEGPLTK